MAEFKSKSLDWLKKLDSLRAQPPGASRPDLQKALDKTNTQITELQAIDACLDPAAIEKIRLAAQDNPPHILSYRNARALSGLKRAKLTDLSTAVHAALDFILTHRLDTTQIENLVEWMLKGNPAESFDPKAKPPKTVEETSETDPGANGNNEPLAQQSLAPQLVASVQMQPESKKEENNKRINTKKVKTETLGQLIGSGIDKIVGFFGGVQVQAHPAGSAKTSGLGQNKTKSTQKELKPVVHWFKKLGKKFAKIAWKELGKVEHRFCRKLAHVIVPLHASSHSTSSRRSRRTHSRGSFRQGLITLFLTPLHWLVYVLLQYGFLFMVATVFVCPFLPALKPWLEWPFRFAAHLVIYDLPSWVWACAQSHLVPTVIIGGLLAVGLVYAWIAKPLRMSLIGAALAYLIIHGRGWSEVTLPHWNTQTVVGENQVVSVLPVETKPVRSSKLGSSRLKTSNSKLLTPNF